MKIINKYKKYQNEGRRLGSHVRPTTLRFCINFNLVKSGKITMMTPDSMVRCRWIVLDSKVNDRGLTSNKNVLKPHKIVS